MGSEVRIPAPVRFDGALGLSECSQARSREPPGARQGLRGGRDAVRDGRPRSPRAFQGPKLRGAGQVWGCQGLWLSVTRAGRWGLWELCGFDCLRVAGPIGAWVPFGAARAWPASWPARLPRVSAATAAGVARLIRSADASVLLGDQSRWASFRATGPWGDSLARLFVGYPPSDFRSLPSAREPRSRSAKSRFT